MNVIKNKDQISTFDKIMTTKSPEKCEGLKGQFTDNTKMPRKHWKHSGLSGSQSRENSNSCKIPFYANLSGKNICQSTPRFGYNVELGTPMLLVEG